MARLCLLFLVLTLAAMTVSAAVAAGTTTMVTTSGTGYNDRRRPLIHDSSMEEDSCQELASHAVCVNPLAIIVEAIVKFFTRLFRWATSSTKNEKYRLRSLVDPSECSSVDEETVEAYQKAICYKLPGIQEDTIEGTFPDGYEYLVSGSGSDSDAECEKLANVDKSPKVSSSGTECSEDLSDDSHQGRPVAEVVDCRLSPTGPRSDKIQLGVGPAAAPGGAVGLPAKVKKD